MKNLKIIIAAALVAITAIGSTQGMRMMMGAPGGSPTGLIYAGGGGFGRGGGGGGGREITLRPDVSKELKISDEQKTKLITARTDMNEKRRGLRDTHGDDFEAIMKAAQELTVATDKEILAVLSADQNKRLKELWIQREGNGVVQNEGIQKEIGFTDAQKAALKALNDKAMAAMQALGEKVQNQEIDFTQMREAMTKNQEVLKVELGKILTAEQTAKLKAMGGVAFTFDKDN